MGNMIRCPHYYGHIVYLCLLRSCFPPSLLLDPIDQQMFGAFLIVFATFFTTTCLQWDYKWFHYFLLALSTGCYMSIL